MKKLIALIFAGLMLFAFAACGDKTDGNDGKNNETLEETKGEDTPKLEGVKAPVDILTAVWGSYGDEEKFFAMGGDFENIVDNAPGAFDITNKDSMASQLVCPENAVAMIDGAASLLHAMNANTFTGAAYHIKDGSEASAFISEMKTAIQGNQWICGFPEKLLVAEVTDEYVVVAFGNGEIIETFKTKLTSQYNFAEIEVEAIG